MIFVEAVKDTPTQNLHESIVNKRTFDDDLCFLQNENRGKAVSAQYSGSEIVWVMRMSIAWRTAPMRLRVAKNTGVHCFHFQTPTPQYGSSNAT